MDELITRHSNLMDVYDPTGRIGLVVDEWGTWWEVEEGTNPGFLYQQNTLRDALVASLHFDIFHQHRRVVMTNIAQTINVLQAVLLTEGDRMVRTPTYHVFEMNKEHHDATSLPISFASHRRRQVENQILNTLSMSASIKDGRSLISITNLDADTAQRVEIELRGADFKFDRSRVLTASRLQDLNSPAQPDSVSPRPLETVTRSGHTLAVEIPARSFVTVELSTDD